MPVSNVTQYSFLGGEVSPWAQGRSDLPAYRQSLKLCLNTVPVEEAAAVRRPGFVDLGITHRGLPGIIRSFQAGGKFGPIGTAHVGNSFVYAIEYTIDGASGYLRLWLNQTDGYPTLMCDAAVGTITSFSAASPTLMTMSAAQDWITGDTILVTVNSGSAANGALVGGRQIVVTKVSTTTFTLKDAMTAASIDGTGAVYTAASATAARIAVLPSTVSVLLNELPAIRMLQSGNYVLVMHWLKAPWLLTISQDEDPVVTFEDADFKEADGPYVDALPGDSQTGNKTATATTADGLTYSVTIGSDGPDYEFAATDVGRCFRIWTQPEAWDVAPTYNAADEVTFNDVYYTALPQQGAVTITAGVAPGQADTVAGIQTFPWSLTADLGRWTSGYISGVTDVDQADVRISFNESAYPLLRLDIDTWQIGLFTPGAAIGNPACGNWVEGRLIVGGTPNRFDMSVAGAFEDFIARRRPLFSPTDRNGNVLDDNAIAASYNSDDRDVSLWFESDKQGVIMGTADGEWLISPLSGSDGGLAPTDIKIRKVSRYKADFTEPVRVGSTLLFLQAARRRIYEYIVDNFSNRFKATPLNANAQHLADQNFGIQELAYQEDPTPILWATTGELGSEGTRHGTTVLLGCTYRRDSDFATVAPVFNGWHQHTHGGGRQFYSITIGTGIVNGKDALMAITYDTAQTSGNYEDAQNPGDGLQVGVYHVEIMSQFGGPV